MPGFGSLAQTPDEPYPEQGAGMPETYQSPAGRAIANLGIGLAKAVWDIPRKLGQAAEVPAGLRREDVTDIPVRHGITGTNQFGSEPQDELVEGTTGSAINRIGTGLPFAPRGIGAFGGKLAKPVEAAQSEVPHQSPYAGWHEAMEGIKAYHGSPHDFDRFDISKIGTGEGAQAYGHGLYFAGNENVARSYRDALAGKTQLKTDHGIIDVDQIADPAQRIAANAIKDSSSPEHARMLVNSFAKVNKEYGPAALQEFEKLQAINAKPNPGNMYEVNIKADPAHFLDWDKPLAEQSEMARQALKSYIDTSDAPNVKILRNLLEQDNAWNAANAGDKYGQWNGERIYRRLNERGGLDTVSAGLREAGIPGIKYLDQGSRPPTQFELDRAKSLLSGAEMNGDPAWIAKQKDNVARLEALMTKPGTHNYVVFDDKLIDILRKYGWAGLVGSAGLLGGKDPSKEM